jgi:transglutaminase-like putative cysteine protease
MMISRKKLVRNTLSLATLSLLAANPSFAGSLFDAFSSVLNSLSGNSSDSYQNAPVEERSISQGENHPLVQSSIDEQSYTPGSMRTFESASVSTSALAPSAYSTSDSSYLFNATLPPSTALLHLEIVFNEQNDNIQFVYAPVSGGKISKRVYLTHGPGKYRIRAWYSSSPDRFQSSAEFIYYGQADVTNTDQRDLSYLLPSNDVQSDDPEIVALARDITVNAVTDAEKAQEIHHWITNNIAYDADAYFNGTYVNQVLDALRTLHDGQSVCNGYANLYAALARASGLRARVIIGAIIWPTQGQTWEQMGNSQAHAWNEVEVDGRWIVVDSTWDSGFLDFKTRKFKRKPRLKYYDPSPDAFAEDHRALKISGV